MATIKTQLSNLRKQNSELNKKLELAQQSVYNQILTQNRFSAMQNALVEMLIEKKTFTRDEITAITKIKVEEADIAIREPLNQYNQRREAQA